LFSKRLEGQQGNEFISAVDTNGTAYFAGKCLSERQNRLQTPVRVSLRLVYSGEGPYNGTLTVTPVGKITASGDGVTEIDEFPEGEHKPTVLEDLPPKCVPFVAAYQSRVVASREVAMVKSAKKR
jgi:hypothetical protein